jgi:hypothetical protein
MSAPETNCLGDHPHTVYQLWIGGALLCRTGWVGRQVGTLVEVIEWVTDVTPEYRRDPDWRGTHTIDQISTTGATLDPQRIRNPREAAA